MRAGLAARGIDLVGLNVDTEPGADVRGFLRENRAGYPAYVGGVAAVERLYLTGQLSVPMSLVVDDKGVVTEVIHGRSPSTRRRFAAPAGKE